MTSTSRSFEAQGSAVSAQSPASQASMQQSSHGQVETLEPSQAALLIKGSSSAWHGAKPAPRAPLKAKRALRIVANANPAPAAGKSSHAKEMRAQNSEIDPIAIAAELGEAIRQQVIPRLLSAHGCAAYETRHDDARLQMQSAPGLENHRAHAALDVAGVAHLAVRGDAIALDAACRHMIDAGMSRDDVFLDRLAPAARLLGEFWRDDTYGFADVALGVCRLRQTFESLRTDELEPQERPDCFRVLIAPAPRETHGFGAAMIGRLFSQAGWAVTVQNPGDEDTVLGLLRTNRFELLGLSLNTDLALEGLSAFVLKAKRESKNQNLTILVGGSLIAARPEIAREVGVIAAPSDPRRAIDEAEKIVRRAVRRM